MAGKSKARKSKTTASKKKTAKAAAPAVKPTYLRPGASYKMGLHDVIRALKMIEKYGQLNKFARAAKALGEGVSVNAGTVNFVKDFIVKHAMHKDPIGKHIVNAAGPAGRTMAVRRGGNPFICKF